MDEGTKITEEDKEWKDALDEFSGIAPEEKKEEEKPADEPKKDDEVKKGDEPIPKADEGVQPISQQGKKPADDADTEIEKDDTKVEKPVEDLAAKKALRETRELQRETLADAKAMQDDIRAELFSDVDNVLKDADGDPITTIEDVQKLINPNTKKPFTEEEAAIWLLSAQQHVNKAAQEAEKKIEEIADTNLSLKDQSDAVREKYGRFLADHPDIRDKVWAEYQTTLIKDEKTNIITKAPVNLERFYDTALEGHIKLAEEQTTKNAAFEAEAKLKKENEQLKVRSDREDIYSAGNNDDGVDKETKGWAKAAKEYYEG